MSVTERKRPQSSNDDDGQMIAQRILDIDATSEADAIAQAGSYTTLGGIGVAIGNTYVEPDGTEREDVFCRSISVNTIVSSPGSPVVGRYVITGNYRSVSASTSSIDRTVPVIGGPAVWRLVLVNQTKSVDIDISGHPITNSAGEPLNPPLQKRTGTVKAIGRWYTTGSDQITVFARYLAFRDKMNAGTFLGQPSGSWLCPGVAVDQVKNLANTFYCETELEYAPPINIPGTLPAATFYGWNTVVVDRGRRKLGTIVNGKLNYPLIKLPDPDDGLMKPVREPVLLNGAGDMATVYVSGKPVPTLLAFDLYGTADFGTLGP